MRGKMQRIISTHCQLKFPQFLHPRLWKALKKCKGKIREEKERNERHHKAKDKNQLLYKTAKLHQKINTGFGYRRSQHHFTYKYKKEIANIPKTNTMREQLFIVIEKILKLREARDMFEVDRRKIVSGKQRMRQLNCHCK